MAGLFVGGLSARMGGKPKGLLAAPEGSSIAERTVLLLRSLGLPVVLVGKALAYEHLQLPAIEDDPAGIGPMGGLAALLSGASGHALAIACDMPFVSAPLLRRLIDAPDAPIVAPRRQGRWEPLFARYESARTMPLIRGRIQAGRYSLQGLLDEAGAGELSLSPAQATELRDWDTPEDVDRER